jgi:UDP-glucose 4-epimerase
MRLRSEMQEPYRILVTGASGFVGSYLTKYLIAQGHSVAIVVRNPRTSARLKEVLSQVTLIESSLEQYLGEKKAFKEFRPDIVYHLAWEGVDKINRDSNNHDINFLNTLNLLKLAYEFGCQSFVGLGSQAEYESSSTALNESSNTNPKSAYGKSKLETFNSSHDLARELGIRFSWIRLFSAYGYSDHENALIPFVIRKLLSKQSPNLTLGEQFWDFVYIDDAVKAIAAVGMETHASGVFNLGSGTAVSIRGTLETLKSIIKTEVELGFGKIPYSLQQIMHLEADIARIKTVTGWQPETTLYNGLTKTVAEYQKHTSESVCA